MAPQGKQYGVNDLHNSSCTSYPSARMQSRYSPLTSPLSTGNVHGSCCISSPTPGEWRMFPTAAVNAELSNDSILS